MKPMNCIVCNKALRQDNTIGACRQHRSYSPKRKAYETRWKHDNYDKYAEAKRRWTKNNLEYYTEYRNKSVTRKLAHILRVRIRRAVKYGSAIKNLGCSLSEFKAHLENNFKTGMSWENYGQWEIDHIKPLSSFNLEDSAQLKSACHFSNMQPLWKSDNIRKHAKLD